MGCDARAFELTLRALSARVAEKVPELIDRQRRLGLIEDGERETPA